MESITTTKIPTATYIPTTTSNYTTTITTTATMPPPLISLNVAVHTPIYPPKMTFLGLSCFDR